MSRLIKKSIPVPAGVTVDQGTGILHFKGPKGTRDLSVLPGVRVNIEKDSVLVTSESDERQHAVNAGTMWSLIKNAIEGVEKGFSRVLEIEGVGYRASMEGKTLVLALGFVNPVRFDPPEGVTITVQKNEITIIGVDKDAVGRAAAEIRSFKKPEPYKGKGIHYRGEVIRRKAGKKAAAAGAAA